MNHKQECEYKVITVSSGDNHKAAKHLDGNDDVLIVERYDGCWWLAEDFFAATDVVYFYG